MGNEMNELRYLDLKNALCEKIYEGIYKDGKKIPSERQLSTDYEVSRITVRKTLELMEKENLIVREVGNGTSGDIEKLWKQILWMLWRLRHHRGILFLQILLQNFKSRHGKKIHYYYM